MFMDDDWLNTRDVARALGLRQRTVTTYLSRSRSKRRDGKPLTSLDFPLPDGTEGPRHSPRWRAEKINRYAAEIGQARKRSGRPLVWVECDHQEIVKGDRIRLPEGLLPVNHGVLFVQRSPVIGPGGTLLVLARKRRSSGWSQMVPPGALIQVLRPETS